MLLFHSKKVIAKITGELGDKLALAVKTLLSKCTLLVFQELGRLPKIINIYTFRNLCVQNSNWGAFIFINVYCSLNFVIVMVLYSSY